MSTEIKEPIPCPHCGKPLSTIQVEKTDVVEWNEEERTFNENSQGSGRSRCYNCGEVIGGYGQTNWGLWPDYE